MNIASLKAVWHLIMGVHNPHPISSSNSCSSGNAASIRHAEHRPADEISHSSPPGKSHSSHHSFRSQTSDSQYNPVNIPPTPPLPSVPPGTPDLRTIFERLAVGKRNLSLAEYKACHKVLLDNVTPEIRYTIGATFSGTIPTPPNSPRIAHVTKQAATAIGQAAEALSAYAGTTTPEPEVHAEDMETEPDSIVNDRMSYRPMFVTPREMLHCFNTDEQLPAGIDFRLDERSIRDHQANLVKLRLSHNVPPLTINQPPFLPDHLCSFKSMETLRGNSRGGTNRQKCFPARPHYFFKASTPTSAHCKRRRLRSSHRSFLATSTTKMVLKLRKVLAENPSIP